MFRLIIRSSITKKVKDFKLCSTMAVVDYWLDELGRARNIYEIRAISKMNNRIDPLPTDEKGRILSRIERKLLNVDK